MVTSAEIGVIGGSGFYSLLDDADEVEVTTPYGPPSDVVTVGRIGSPHGGLRAPPRPRPPLPAPPHPLPRQPVGAALPRRPPGPRPERRRLPAPELGPGALVVPDQLVDRTSGRVQTYYDAGGAVHVRLRRPLLPLRPRGGRLHRPAAGWDLVDGGTLVVIEGPRFSTRAESRWYAANGWTIIGMTGHPEAVLARELALCYTSLSLVTDHDAGVEAGEGVTHEEVLAFFAANIARMRSLVADVVPALPERTHLPLRHRPRRHQAPLRPPLTPR